VVIHPKETYDINDVITFAGTSGRVVTHRIISVDRDQAEKKYATKGDANRSEDEDIITDDQIIGKISMVIPKLGYFMSFIKSKSGLIFILIIPAIIFILDELFKLKKNVKFRD
jgi:signal peptidase